MYFKHLNKKHLTIFFLSVLTDGVDDFASGGVRKLFRRDHHIGYVAGHHWEHPHGKVRQWRVRPVLSKKKKYIYIRFLSWFRRRGSLTSLYTAPQRLHNDTRVVQVFHEHLRGRVVYHMLSKAIGGDKSHANISSPKSLPSHFSIASCI